LLSRKPTFGEAARAPDYPRMTAENSDTAGLMSNHQSIPWQVVKQNGSLGLMPAAELYRYTYIHEGIAAIMDALTELAARMSVASAIAKRAPEGDFTPRDVEDLITATSEVQGRLEFVTSLLQLEKIGLNREWR
jgi:hypothetical protein